MTPNNFFKFCHSDINLMTSKIFSKCIPWLHFKCFLIFLCFHILILILHLPSSFTHDKLFIVLYKFAHFIVIDIFLNKIFITMKRCSIIASALGITFRIFLSFSTKVKLILVLCLPVSNVTSFSICLLKSALVFF